MAKQRLVLLLGAGSTVSAGAPTTDAITAHVRALSKSSGLVKAVVNGLEAQRGLHFNFETVIDALEELIDFLLRSRQPDAWDLIGGVLSAFSRISPPFDNESLSNPFEIDRHRIGLLASINRFVSERTTRAPATELKSFLDKLRNHFRLTVFTLNYDDLIDRAGSWFDGFIEGCDAGVAHFHFDVSAFRERFLTEPAALAHLHGSVRFGYHDEQNPEIVKYEDVKAALSSLQQPPSNAASPIISGREKETKLLRTPIPLGFYYHAFTEALLETPRFLIAGYGARDPHVNTWFDEFTRLHGDRGRVVSIDLNSIDLELPVVARSVRYLPFRVSFPPKDEATLSHIIKHLLAV